MKLTLFSSCQRQLGAPAQSSKDPPEPKYPLAPTTFTLTPPPLTMVTTSPITMNLYTNSCSTARVIYQTVVCVFFNTSVAVETQTDGEGKKRLWCRCEDGAWQVHLSPCWDSGDLWKHAGSFIPLLSPSCSLILSQLELVQSNISVTTN